MYKIYLNLYLDYNTKNRLSQDVDTKKKRGNYILSLYKQALKKEKLNFTVELPLQKRIFMKNIVVIAVCLFLINNMLLT